tara:strand:- start:114 stop:239 length:126 start_codon:yes stop_codon:yes gene_type:complete
MKTYELRIVMVAIDKWDFVNAMLAMKDKEFIDHITEIEEEE